MLEHVYSYYGDLSVEQYVQHYILNSSEEMERMRQTADLLDAEVKTVLDVGAGHGIFLDILKKEKNIKGTGVELTQAKVDYGNSIGVNMVKASADQLPFENKSFEAITSCEVIEHLPYQVYEAALAEFERVSSKWIMITVPYNEKRKLIACPYCDSKVNPSLHFRSFNEENLTSLFKTFTLKKVTYLGHQRRSIFSNIYDYLPEKWHNLLTCPVCNYANPAAVNRSSYVSNHKEKPSLRLKLLKAMASLTPRKDVYRWIVGIYEKT